MARRLAAGMAYGPGISPAPLESGDSDTQRAPRLLILVARMIIAEEGFRARGREFDRTIELARGPKHERELDEHAVARAEISAYVAGEHPHMVAGNAEDRGKLALLPHRAAAAGIERVAGARCLVLAERGARLK